LKHNYFYGVGLGNDVLEKNPPKQGLKLQIKRVSFGPFFCFREKSTKTRIETLSMSDEDIKRNKVLEKNPPKQGLKRSPKIVKQ